MRGLVLAALVTGSISAGQPVFKSAVQLVTVPITVTNDARDKLITNGLTADDFRIYENGVLQQVAVFSQDRQPISICFVVDASGSMDSDRRLERGIRALQETARGLEDGDEVAIVRFAAIAATTHQWKPAPDAGRLSWRLDPGAGSVVNTSIMDGVRKALKEIDQARNQRRVIVVISDGYENASVTPMSRIVSTRQQSETPIYAFGVAGPVERAPAVGMLRNILPELVSDTGGVYWKVSTPEEAAFAAKSLLYELKYQLTLGYTPTTPFDGKYRKLRVETTVPNLLVRHRGGYLALPSTTP